MAFKAGIPIDFDPNDLFVYFESLTSNSTHADFLTARLNRAHSYEEQEDAIARAQAKEQEVINAKNALASQVMAAYNDIGNQLAYSANNSGDGVNAIGASLNFLKKAAETERAKELKVLSRLHKDIVHKMEELERIKALDDRFGGKRKAKKALKKVRQAYQDLNEILNSNDIVYDLNFYTKVTTLFNAYHQLSDDFASDMSDMFLRNDDGSFIEGTTSAKVSNVDAAKERKKRGIAFSSIADFNVTSTLSGVLSRFMNRGREIKRAKGEEALAQLITNEIINFLTSGGTTAFSQDMSIEQFFGLIAILNIEISRKINNDFLKNPAFNKANKGLSEATLVHEIREFLKEYEKGDDGTPKSLGAVYARERDGILSMSAAQRKEYIESITEFLGIKLTSSEKNALIGRQDYKDRHLSAPRKSRKIRDDTQEIVKRLKAAGILEKLGIGVGKNDRETAQEFANLVKGLTFRTDFNTNQFMGEFAERVVAGLQVGITNGRMTSGGVKITGHAATDVITAGAIVADGYDHSVKFFLDREKKVIEGYNKVMDEIVEDVVVGESRRAKEGSYTRGEIRQQKIEYKKAQEKIYAAYKNKRDKEGQEGLNFANYFVMNHTIKMYRTATQNSSMSARESRFQGFHGRKLNFKNFISELLGLVDMAGTALPTADVQLLVSAAINSREGTLLGTQFKDVLEMYFTQFMSLLMFSDAGLMVKDTVLNLTKNLIHEDYMRIHLFTLNNNYVPASMILQGVYERCQDMGAAITSFSYDVKGQDLARATNVRTHISTGSFSELEAIANNTAYKPYNTRWSVVSNHALLDTQIEITFFRGFLKMMEKMFA